MDHIGILERIFIWLGGYTPDNLADDSRQNREPVSKLGATVLFAMVVAGLNWAVGGWIYAEALSEPQRYWAAGATSLMGMFLVLVFDRGLIYVIDTSGKVARIRLVAFTLFRFVVVVAVSSLTSQAVIPLLLGNELNMKALQMQEASEQRRVSQLGQQYQVSTRESAVSQANQDVARLTQANQTLPPDISNHLAAARQCWQEYRSTHSNLLNNGMEPREARERLRTKATACSQADISAKAEQAAYFKRTREQLVQATDNQETARNELQTANTAIASRVDTARQIESRNLTPRSSAVLWELLSSNPGAMGKWLLITAVLLVCELLPLLYKLQMGQTPPGRRIATENRLYQRQLEADSVQHEQALTLQEEISHASHTGMQEAMKQPEVRQVFTDCFATKLKVLAPSEAVASMMHDLHTRGPDVISFQRRHPQYAQVIGEAWRNALAQTMDILMAAAPKPTGRVGPRV